MTPRRRRYIPTTPRTISTTKQAAPRGRTTRASPLSIARSPKLSTAKTEFVTWLHGHSPALAGRLFGVEPLQHMSDGQIVAEARRFFKRADRIRPPAP
jgi:hypothetical protein